MATTFLVSKNNAESTLASGISDSATSLTVATGEGSKFPSTYPFHITIEDEILRCTNRSSDVLTVVRAQEGTSAAAHSADKEVRLNITAKALSDLSSAVNAIEDKANIHDVYMHAHLTSSQSLTTPGIWEKIAVDTALFDLGSNYDGTEKAFKAPVSGYYRVVGNIGFTGTANGDRYMVGIFVGASWAARVQRSWVAYHASSNLACYGCAAVIVYANANDYIYLGADSSDSACAAYGHSTAGQCITFLSVELVRGD